MQFQNLTHEFADKKQCDKTCNESKVPACVPAEYQAAFPAGTAAGKMQHYPPNNQPAINLVDKNAGDLAEKHLKFFKNQEENLKSAQQQQELLTKASKPTDKTGQEGLDRNIPAPDKASQNVGMHGVEFTEKNQDKIMGGNAGNTAVNAPTPNMSTVNVKPNQGTGAPEQDPQHIAGGYTGGPDTKNINVSNQSEEVKAQSGPQQKELTTKASRIDDKKLNEGAQPSGNHIVGQDAQARGPTTHTGANPADKLKEDMASEVKKYEDNAKPDYGAARGEQGQSYSEKGVDKLPDARGYGNTHRIYP